MNENDTEEITENDTDEKITDKFVQKQLEVRSTEAEELLQDEDKMERFLERLERKLKKIPIIGSRLASVPVMISLVRSYIKKEYTDIPIGSMIAIVAGLIYVLSSIDLIPDTIPGLGMVDDGLVIAGVLKLVSDDVEEYEDWQRKNGKRIFDDDELPSNNGKSKNS